MSDAPPPPSPRSGAGPSWMWFTAWSAQGLMLLAVDALAFENAWVRFAVVGLLAAVPLVVLYLVLRRYRP